MTRVFKFSWIQCGITLVGLLYILGCAQIKTRRDSEPAPTHESRQGSTPSTEDGRQNLNQDEGPQDESSQDESDQSESRNETRDQEDAPPPQPPAPPRVGLILGPGGMRAWAHSAVLHEFVKARIPIHAIVGIEWGALVAATFAEKGEVHNVDWQLFKLKNEQLPSKGFFNRSASAIPADQLSEYLSSTLKQNKVEDFRLPFACPSFALATGDVYWQVRGMATLALQKCLPYPPTYQPYKGWTAAAFALRESYDWLKGKGVELVILVNVLSSYDFFDRSILKEDPLTLLHWAQLRREILKFRPLSNQPRYERIDVDLNGVSIVDYERRTQVLKMGVLRPSLSDLARKHGF